MGENLSLIASRRDEASMNMVKFLTSVMDFRMTSRNSRVYESDEYRNVRLYLTDKELLFLNDFNNDGDPFSSFIFLSKHRSASGIASLTCHSTGNFSQDNLYGGEPNELGLAYPSLEKAYFNELYRNHNTFLDYQITLEATHHGPTSFRGPILFVEIGSGPTQWTDWNAAAAVCNSILKISPLELKGSSKAAIALGGTHYPTKLNRILLETDFSIAYIVTRNNLQLICSEMMQQMIARSTEKITHILLDWKGLGKDKKNVLDTIGATNLEVVRI
jgi:D-aminoacyl-tRNA deacylase